MGQTIGAAGRHYGLGRVAALTKAVNSENLYQNNEDFFVRMLKNVILWAKSDMYLNNNVGQQYGPRNSVAILKNNNEDFDEKIQDMLQSINQGVTMIDPWYERGPFTGNGWAYKFGLIILIPSYSALDGVRMRDDTQRQILNDVYSYGTGLVIAEWFHLLNSLPNKRSFTYDDPNSVDPIAGLEDNGRVAGLIDASPFIPENNVVFSDADVITYSVNDINDDTSFAIAPSFQLRNVALDTPFDGHISQLGEVKDDSIIFWNTDLPAEVTTTTTTTTTTTAIPYDDIKLKVGTFYLENVCGPQKLYLSGEDADFFLMEDKDIYLIRNIEEPVELNFDIVAEDYFENKRFTTVVEHMTINLIECDKPITLPKNGSRPQYSYRDPESGAFAQVWGDNAPREVIAPYEEYSFTGQGLVEKPAIVCLGGKHNDENAFWMQVNEGGEYNITIDKDLSYTDCVSLWLIENTAESNFHPAQHDDLFADWVNSAVNDGANVNNIISNLSNFWYYQCGKGQISSTFNVDQPMAVDPEDQNTLLRGEAYLVFALHKNLYTSDHTDTACITVTYGTTTTPPPPEYDFVVFIQNDAFDVDVVDLNGDPITGFSYTSIATNNPGVERVGFYVRVSDPETAFEDLIIAEDSDYILLGIEQAGSVTQRLVYVYLTEMPVNGGQATITIVGSAVTTTPAPTTPPPPTYQVIVNITDDLGLVYLDAYTKTFELQAGGPYNVFFTWNTNAGFEYRPSTPATANPYQFYDRPTITQIIDQDPLGMVSLPSPTPNDTNINTISVGRGVYGNWSTNTSGRIGIPIAVPVLGGEITLRMSGQEPVPTTTTTTTTTEPPCDDTIYVICRQVLNCEEGDDGNCVPRSDSYQEVVFSTCCPISDEEALETIRSHNQTTETNLNVIYAADCPQYNFDLLAPCFAKDSRGNCQETIHSEIIDTIFCIASQNPLP